MIAKLAPYRKTIAAITVGLIGWGTQVVTSAQGPVTAQEWVALATVLAVTGGVYSVANKPAPQ